MEQDRAGRRTFLRTAAMTAAGAGLGPALTALFGSHRAPAIVRAQQARPSIEWGVASGDVAADGAVVWSRTDRPARMIVEWDTTDRFAAPRRVAGPIVTEHTDYTAKTTLTGLPGGQRIVYRVSFEDLSDGRATSEEARGSFVTPPDGGSAARDVTLAFTADTCGQGWGIDPARGGMQIYESMRRLAPDLFVHLGDTIYADQPLVAEVTLDDGTVWNNLVTPEKSKVAETLGEFRGNFRYNLLDEHVRRFNAAVSQLVIWDDHEVLNNWYPTLRLDQDARYTVKSAALLAARARIAFFEYNPIRRNAADPDRIYRTCRFGPHLELFAWDMRSYRGANSPGREPVLTAASSILGAEQRAWLKQRLESSQATWKIIASDMPIGLIVPDFPPTLGTYEAVANGDGGPPLGRELEIADLLRFIKTRRIRNVLFITADVHYAAAYHYSPERARFAEFEPFWELVAGPAHAGTFGPNRLDPTFGPELKFLGIPLDMKPNRPPSDGLQFFGSIRIDARTRALTARLHNRAGDVVHTLELAPDV